MISAAPAYAPVKAAYPCGPVQLVIDYEDASLRDALYPLLSQYDAPWGEQTSTIRVVVERRCQCDDANELDREFPPPHVAGAKPSGLYLESYRLRVKRDGHRLLSLSNVGVWMEFDAESGSARIVVSAHPDWPTVVEEVEQQFVLLLTRAWAQAGWTPLHAGTLVPPNGDRCALICAASGTGKSTLVAALLHRGWRTLGDDKTLLRHENRQLVARALAWRFHLHPASSRWFADVSNINCWPTYSRWTEKRVVHAGDVWPGQLITTATPAAIIRLERTECGVAFESLDRVNAMKTIVNQVAIPSDAEHAKPLVACVASVVMTANTAVMKIGHDAFSDSATVDELDAGLRTLLQ